MADPAFESAMDALDAWTLTGQKGTFAAFRSALARVQSGIPKEQEFAALARWGGARVAARLSQRPGSAAPGVFVPDLFVIASVNGRDVPFFVEVKSTESSHDRIPLSEKYVREMRRFQEMSALPLLVAGKFRWGLWVLREVSTLEPVRTAYRLTLADMKESLMGLLFADRHISVEPESGLVLELTRPDHLPWANLGENTVTVTRAYVDGRHGRFMGPVSLLFAFLQAAGAEEREFLDGPTFRLEVRTPPPEPGTNGAEVLQGVTSHQIMSAYVTETYGEDPRGWARLLEVVDEAPRPDELCDNLRVAGLARLVGHLRPANTTAHFEALLESH